MAKTHFSATVIGLPEKEDILSVTSATQHSGGIATVWDTDSAGTPPTNSNLPSLFTNLGKYGSTATKYITINVQSCYFTTSSDSSTAYNSQLNLKINIDWDKVGARGGVVKYSGQLVTIVKDGDYTEAIQLMGSFPIAGISNTNLKVPIYLATQRTGPKSKVDPMNPILPTTNAVMMELGLNTLSRKITALPYLSLYPRNSWAVFAHSVIADRKGKNQQYPQTTWEIEFDDNVSIGGGKVSGTIDGTKISELPPVPSLEDADLMVLSRDNGADGTYDITNRIQVSDFKASMSDTGFTATVYDVGEVLGGAILDNSMFLMQYLDGAGGWFINEYDKTAGTLIQRHQPPIGLNQWTGTNGWGGAAAWTQAHLYDVYAADGSVVDLTNEANLVWVGAERMWKHKFNRITGQSSWTFMGVVQGGNANSGWRPIGTIYDPVNPTRPNVMTCYAANVNNANNVNQVRIQRFQWNGVKYVTSSAAQDRRYLNWLGASTGAGFPGELWQMLYPGVAYGNKDQTAANPVGGGGRQWMPVISINPWTGRSFAYGVQMLPGYFSFQVDDNNPGNSYGAKFWSALSNPRPNSGEPGQVQLTIHKNFFSNKTAHASDNSQTYMASFIDYDLDTGMPKNIMQWNRRVYGGSVFVSPIKSEWLG